MLKELSTAFAVIGIIMSLFQKKYPKLAGWGYSLGLIGLLGIVRFS